MAKKNRSNAKTWLITLEGVLEDDVHGVRLRNDIVKWIYELAKEKSVRFPFGEVRNIKNKPLLKIYLVSKTIRFPKMVCLLIRKKLYKKEIKVESPIDISKSAPPNSFEKLGIHREDELTEMVWALQGAGKVFENSSLQQKKLVQKTAQLLNFMEVRDDYKEFSRLFALDQELDALKAALKNKKLRSRLLTESPRNVLCYSCLEESCTNPPSSEQPVIIATTSLLFALEDLEIKDMLHTKRLQSQALHFLMGRIRDLQGVVRWKLDALEEGLYGG